MIKHNNTKAIEDKILTIVALCKKIGAEFDNTTPNKYMKIINLSSQHTKMF